VRDIVRQLYDNLLKLTGQRTTGEQQEFMELFPPLNLLDEKTCDELAKVLGTEIESASLFEQALTHRSYLQVVQQSGHRSNERLEFLGDAILGLVTAEYLFYNNKQVLEGELTKMRSWLVNKKSLAICARALGLDQFIFLSYSARQSLDKGNDGLLADALEAVIAAVYLDQGFEKARTFIVNKLLPIMVSESLVHDTNYKSLLLEAAQARGQGTPRYVVTNEEGPDHDKTFTVDVIVGEERMGTGTGRNKKDAEQRAAERALAGITRRGRSHRPHT
jgi:ribonuclease-3